LEQIQQWREDNLTEIAQSVGATLHYPIWKVPYSVLSADLWASGVPCIISAVTLDPDTTKCGEGQKLPVVDDLYSPQLVAALPDGVDTFGECGEFHTLAQVWLAVDSALAVHGTSLAKGH